MEFLTAGVMRVRGTIFGLCGPGGSGKSFVMRAVADAVEAEGWNVLFATMSHSALRSCPEEFPRLVLASLCVRCGWRNHSKKTPAERKVAQWFTSTRRILVIDEAFQLTAAYLAKVFSALQGYSSVVRGGVRVILVGDPGQTKPVGGKPITAHPEVQRAKWSKLTSGTMRMTKDWACDVNSFGQNVLFADASLKQYKRSSPPPGVMIITPTRQASIDATTKYLLGSDAFTVLPMIPDPEREGEVPSLETRKASEPFLCEPGNPSRLVYNVRTIDGSRTTPGGFELNNNSMVWFSGIVDKNGDCIALERGMEFRLTSKHFVRIRVQGESSPIVLAPFKSEDIIVVPLRPWRVKTVHAAQGETIKDGVFLYADGSVQQSVYVTAAGRVPSSDKFFVADSVTRVESDK